MHLFNTTLFIFRRHSGDLHGFTPGNSYNFISKYDSHHFCKVYSVTAEIQYEGNDIVSGASIYSGGWCVCRARMVHKKCIAEGKTKWNAQKWGSSDKY